MQHTMSHSYPIALAVAAGLVLAACGGEGEEQAAQAANPAPWQGAHELQLGEAHRFGDGHTVSYRQVEHHVELPMFDAGQLGLVAEIEVCAGQASLEFAPYSTKLFSETSIDMQGETMTMHGENATAQLGLREPELGMVALEPGACARGWVDFINIYGELGEPTVLGFTEPGSDARADAVWQVPEAG